MTSAAKYKFSWIKFFRFVNGHSQESMGSRSRSNVPKVWPRNMVKAPETKEDKRTKHRLAQEAAASASHPSAADCTTPPEMAPKSRPRRGGLIGEFTNLLLRFNSANDTHAAKPSKTQQPKAESVGDPLKKAFGLLKTQQFAKVISKRAENDTYPEEAPSRRSKRAGVITILWRFLFGSDDSSSADTQKIALAQYVSTMRMAALTHDVQRLEDQEQLTIDSSNRVIDGIDEMSKGMQKFSINTLNLMLAEEYNHMTLLCIAMERKYELLMNSAHWASTFQDLHEEIKMRTPMRWLKVKLSPPWKYHWYTRRSSRCWNFSQFQT